MWGGRNGGSSRGWWDIEHWGDRGEGWGDE